MHPAFQQTDHRPWPVPRRPWAWQMKWLYLAFIHYEADAAELRKLLPPGIELDLHDGKAWLGIVPFRIEGVTKRGWPAPAFLCDFAEINVRTYVKAQGKTGVWFLSLDAHNVLAAWTARTFFYAPYRAAEVSMREDSSGIHFSAHCGGREFLGRYAPGEAVAGQPGTFENWATERYCLYSCRSSDGRVFRTEVQHPKWSLRRAHLQIEQNTLTGLKLGPIHPTVLFARQVDVVMWPLEAVN